MNKKLIRRVRDLLKNREMRLFLFDFMQTCQTFSHGFVPNDPHATSFHAGQRSMGLYLFDLIMAASPDAFVQMRREWNEEVKSKPSGAQEKHLWQPDCTEEKELQ
ncbi:MAG: hypothetical protein SOT02_00535 [Elusimicrobiaceae bacterium]|mgnify:FL=1|uniref:Bbp19 family protein n=1 Tax=Candidatus Avelusimicrobium faecicola TaxID=3416205 RepID=UPI002A7CCA05|nr:hypothetical protein [Spirochaetota bacterium]MDY2939434.1 hypothetical protein [Elusimicrobiaceae bacterium]